MFSKARSGGRRGIGARVRLGLGDRVRARWRLRRRHGNVRRLRIRRRALRAKTLGHRAIEGVSLPAVMHHPEMSSGVETGPGYLDAADSTIRRDSISRRDRASPANEIAGFVGFWPRARVAAGPGKPFGCIRSIRRISVR
jgi:hypothetical protein